jgi:glycosyltransferase involved in cell wall biosynthesis
VQVETGELENIANIKFLGAKPHNELVNYINQFAVCTVPYANTQSTATVVPTKINEYLATGKPVVATELPTIREFNKEHGLLMLAPANAQAFSAAITAALRTTEDEALSRRRRELAESADWGLRLARISEIIEQRMAERKP